MRLVVLLLVLANAGYLAWTQGWLASYGLAPVQQREPQRVAEQINPSAIRVLPPDEARRVEAAASQAAAPSVSCLASSLLNEASGRGLRSVLESGWPAGAWVFEPSVESARWIVYMGKYPNADAVARKKAELRQLGLSFQPLLNPAMEPGLSLGTYGTQAEANAQLNALTRRGVRTARVVQERQEVRGELLRLPAVDEALRARLEELTPHLGGKPLVPCR
jgi:hypothetical protein